MEIQSAIYFTELKYWVEPYEFDLQNKNQHKISLTIKVYVKAYLEKKLHVKKMTTKERDHLLKNKTKQTNHNAKILFVNKALGYVAVFK